MYIESGSPWENGYCESFNSKLRDEFLNGEIFYSMKELRVLAERWRVHYNTVRSHSSLGYRPPAPEAWLTNNMGCGEVETATRFPLLHTPDGGYLNSEIAALHSLIQQHKRSGTPGCGSFVASVADVQSILREWAGRKGQPTRVCLDSSTL